MDSDLGLDFILALKPVRYKFKNYVAIEYNEVEKGDDENGQAIIEIVEIKHPRTFTRPHYGLVAQDVVTAMQEKKIDDFAGFVINEQGEYGLRYTEFIAPIIKAIQEQQKMIDDLKAGGLQARVEK